MKHRLSLFAGLLMAMAIPHSAFAYDFSAVAPTGQTLYYSIVGSFYDDNTNSYYNGAALENPLPSSYPSYVSGALIIPDTVTYDGVDYVVTSIGNHAFDGCSDLTTPNTNW